MDTFNEMQTLKRRFFAMRNGVVADRMRRAGSAYRIIFGLNLPQLRDIAADLGINVALGQRLWENTSTRESRLLAPMLLDIDAITTADAVRMLTDAATDTETVDILCHALLRRHPKAAHIAETLYATAADTPLRYAALRLAANVADTHPKMALEMAQREFKRRDPRTATTAWNLIQDITDPL